MKDPREAIRERCGAIRARVTAVSTGPWVDYHGDKVGYCDWLADYAEDADMELVNNAPEDIAWLLDQLTEHDRRLDAIAEADRNYADTEQDEYLFRQTVRAILDAPINETESRNV
jgi:hypothetical protein